MSADAICIAVKNQIRTVLTLPDDRWIDVRPDEKPPSSNVADAYIAVHSEGQNYGDLNSGIDEYQNVGVTITLRVTQFHVDYWGRKVSETLEQSMNYCIRKIIGCIHLNSDVINAANQLIETGISSGFIEMLKVKSVGRKQERGVSWYGVSKSTEGANRVVAFSSTILFSGARRIQSLDAYT